MAGITQNGQKRKVLFSLWSPSRESNQKYFTLLMEGSCNYNDSDNKDNSNNSDNDKDDISDKLTF